MQYIFGDNRSSYAMIYTDGTDADAQKLNGLLRFPIVPNEKYNSRGFLSYGTNGCCALFFEIKKDRTIPRSCYFTHGFSREGDPSYYGSAQFLEDIFAQFITQEKFDVIRDGAEGGFEMRADSTLCAQADQASVIDPRVLREAVANLYQKNPVLLAIDDDKYSDAAVCAILKRIYTYLTPCLRKATSFLSAIVDTGNAEVMIRIVPKSMLAEVRTPYMNVDGSDFVPGAEDVFHKLTDALMDASMPQWKAVFFENYEVLYSGSDSVYKKQNAEELYITIADGDLVKLEKIVDGYLLKHSVTRSAEITKLAETLRTPYNKESELEKRFVFEAKDVLAPEQILANNNLFIYKAMLFSDIGKAFLDKYIRKACADTVISEENYETLIRALKTVDVAIKDESAKVQDAYFYKQIAGAVYLGDVQPRLLGYKQLRKGLVEAIMNVIAPMEPIEPSEWAELKAQLLNEAVADIEKHPDKNINITSFIDGKIEETMNTHNEEFMSGAKGVVKYPNEIVVAKLAQIEEAIAAGTPSNDLVPMFTEALRFQDNYRFMMNDLLAQFVIRAYRKGEIRGICGFFKANCDETRVDEVITKVKQYDLATALAFTLDVPVNADKALGKVLTAIMKNEAENSKMTPSAIKAFADVVGAALQRYIGQNASQAERVVPSFRKAMDSCDKKSNTHQILESVLHVSKNGASKDAGGNGGKKNEMMLGAVTLVAAIAIALAGLFAVGLIDPLFDLRPDTTDAFDDEDDDDDDDDDKKSDEDEGEKDTDGETEPDVPDNGNAGGSGDEPADSGDEPADSGDEPADSGDEPADSSDEPADSGDEPADSGVAGE